MHNIILCLLHVCLVYCIFGLMADVDKFLHESALELQEVFDQRRFDNTERTLRRCVGEAIKSIGRLETDVMILCRSIKEKEVTRKICLTVINAIIALKLTFLSM